MTARRISVVDLPTPNPNTFKYTSYSRATINTIVSITRRGCTRIVYVYFEVMSASGDTQFGLSVSSTRMFFASGPEIHSLILPVPARNSLKTEPSGARLVSSGTSFGKHTPPYGAPTRRPYLRLRKHSAVEDTRYRTFCASIVGSRWFARP